jgi:hypothetical protein
MAAAVINFIAGKFKTSPEGFHSRKCKTNLNKDEFYLKKYNKFIE